MNILYLTFDYPPDPWWGMGVHVHELVEYMKGRGHRPMIGTVDRYGRMDPADTALIFNPCRKSVADNAAQRMCTCILKTDPHCFDDLGGTVIKALKDEAFWPDLIHVHGWMMARTAAAVKKATGAPILSTIHFLDIQYDNMGTEHPGGAWQKDEYLLREAEMISGSDHLLSISEFGKELLRAAYPAHAGKTRVVRHGIHVPSIPENGTVRAGGRKPVVTFVGRLVPDEKGVEPFCAAMSDPRLLGRTEVNVIGTGPLLEKLRRDYGRHFNITGYLPRADVKKKVLASDLMAIPSLEEHFGLVVLEGMALGAVPVASNSGAFREIVQDGHNGFLFEVDRVGGIPRVDPVKLRDSVLRALAAPLEDLNRMRLLNRSCIEKQYSLERMSGDTMNYYTEIAGARRTGQARAD